MMMTDCELMYGEEGSLNARECLELVSKDQMRPDQLYEFFANRVSRLVVLYQKSDSGKKPFLSRGNKPGSKYVVAFTDLDAARQVQVHHPNLIEMVEEPALRFLIKAYRSDADGIVLNPGLASRLFVVKHHVLQLMREYAVTKFSQLPGAWVPTLNQNLLLVEYQKGLYTVAIYTSVEDAGFICQKSGGVAVQHPWEVIFDRCRQLKAPAPYLHFGLPEQTPLTYQHAEKIWRGKRNGYVEEEPFIHDFMVKASAPEPQKIEEAVQKPEKQTEQSYQHPEPVEPKNLEPKKTAKEQTIVEVKRNPYSIKNQKSPGSEIYVGANQVKQNDEWPVRSNARSAREDVRQLKPSVESVHSRKNDPKLHRNQPAPLPAPPPPRPAQAPSALADPAIEAGLKKLERATVEGQGMANGWEVCRAMAELRRIWVVVDPEGNMVILAGQDQSPIVDFFTSSRHAQVLIDEAHQKNPSLPAMTPRLVSTKKLYKALAPRQPIVWINRGSPEAWTSIMGDTLPYVLQLMSQLEKEKI